MLLRIFMVQTVMINIFYCKQGILWSKQLLLFLQPNHTDHASRLSFTAIREKGVSF